jgi:hypothetical protein
MEILTAEARKKFNSGGSPDSITSVSPPQQLLLSPTGANNGTQQLPQPQFSSSTTRRLRTATSSNSMNTISSSGGLGSILGYGSNGTLPSLEFWEEVEEGKCRKFRFFSEKWNVDENRLIIWTYQSSCYLLRFLLKHKQMFAL